MPIVCLLFALLLLPAAHAETVVRFPVRAADGIAAWNTKVAYGIRLREAAYPSTGYRECAEVAELNGAYLCANRNRLEMAAGLARASAYIEGIGKELSGGLPVAKGQILSLDSPEIAAYSAGVLGYDLKGPDLVAFYGALNRACTDSGAAPNVCPSAAEKEIFDKLILPRASKGQGFVVITYTLDHDSYQQVVSHEILHAQYFLRPAYAAAVDKFWAALPEEEREAIRYGLEDYYDRTDEFLMKNEFQAHVLMYRAEESLLAMYLPSYREKLFGRLAQVRETPLQVK
ncbi:MAG: hypothetical protein EOP11_15290 [Proteobacteria bacterium]|nr:MAG: hypothetical protein EOP11_15290 [Pseudomonadota bacterium]